MRVRAIETQYKGYRFRSRLEARWAVCFDRLGIPWDYEPEGYDLDGVPYLPDFWLPSWHCFVEIKPAAPSIEEREKCVRLAAATGRRCLLIFGTPGEDTYRIYNIWPNYPASDSDGPSLDWECEAHNVLAACRKCDGFNLLWRADRDISDAWGFSSIGPCGNPSRCCEKFPTAHGGALTSAYAQARGARFGAHDGKGRQRG